jgi:two-component system, NarL family, sensor histidine kinase UhpB
MEIALIFIITVSFTILASVLLILSVKVNHKRKLLHQQQLITKELEIRQKTLQQISSDLHDDIGASLSGIKMFSGLALRLLQEKNLQGAELNIVKANTYTQQVIDAVKDMLWLLRPDNQNLFGVMEQFKKYAIETAEAKQITLHTDVTEEAAAFPLTLLQQKNIYLIGKEAVNNAVKYSGCKNIFCSADKNDTSLTISLKDDGAGFNTTNSSNGFGLKSMQERAKEIEAVFSITSLPGQGTAITLQLPHTP